MGDVTLIVALPRRAGRGDGAGAAVGDVVSRGRSRRTSSTSTCWPSCGGSTFRRPSLPTTRRSSAGVRLDVTGQLPTPDEVRAFLADTDADKRAQKIDELLAEPGYAALWTLKFCDLLKAQRLRRLRRRPGRAVTTRRAFRRGSAPGSRRTCPTTSSSSASCWPPAATAGALDEWSQEVDRAAGGLHRRRQGPGALQPAQDARPLLAAARTPSACPARCRSRTRSSACGWNVPSATAIRTTSGSRTTC